MRLQIIRIPRGFTLLLVWQSHDQQKKRQKSFGDVEMSKRSPKPEKEEEQRWVARGTKSGMIPRWE